MKLKYWIFIFIGIVLLGSLSIGVYYSVKQTVAPSGEYIQAPVFMYYECTPAREITDSDPVTIPKDGAWYECPSNSDGCTIYGVGESDVLLNRRFKIQICEKGTNNCQAERSIDLERNWKPFKKDTSKAVVELATLTLKQVMYVTYQRYLVYWGNREGGLLYAQYHPFILWKVGMFGGGKNEYTDMEQGCVFPTGDKKDLINAILDLSKPANQQTSTETYKLTPYKTRNFIETFVPLSKENVNFVSYYGKDGYCLNRNIHSIATVQTESATYRIVDVNYNNIIKQGVTCCPGEKEPTRKCNENFEWESIKGSQCSAFNPCAGTDWYPSGKPKELIVYNCENGFCVPDTKLVECTSDEDCASSNKGRYCDTKDWKCVSVAPPNRTKREICDNNIDDNDNGLIDLQDPECKKKEECGAWLEIGGKTIIPDIWCLLNKFVEKFRIVLSIIIGFLAGLFAGLLPLKFLDDKKIRKYWWILLITFIVVGSLVGYLAYSYFWVALLILILFIIVKIILR